MFGLAMAMLTILIGGIGTRILINVDKTFLYGDGVYGTIVVAALIGVFSEFGLRWAIEKVIKDLDKPPNNP